MSDCEDSSSPNKLTALRDKKDSVADVISIPQFYDGRSIFITGGTGFMGKVLVEKLLRSCPGIKNIYLLIRPKRGQEINSRLSEIINGPLFDKLRKERPNDLNKIIPIHGDITSEELGISEADQALLSRTVSVVFHSAATVKFDEKLKLSVTINMLGTKRLVQLCQRMISLDALVHVSTAYCNCDRYDVGETIYSPPYSPDDIISLVQWLPEDLLDKLTPSLIGNRPNTYTFTKALAESMLLKEAGNLPVAIVRPSIVLASVNEPLRGWVDNWNGPTGIVSAVGKGIFHTIMCNEESVADFIPVDMVINLMVAAAWKRALTKPAGMTIYNCCTGEVKPITWGRLVSLAIEKMRIHPLEGTFWYPTGNLRRNRFLNAIHSVLAHYIPAYILDILARMAGKKPIMIKVQDKLAKSVQCLEYFTTHQWKFHGDNVVALLDALTQDDRQNFQFDVRTIQWEDYVENYVLGFRQFLFKMNPSSLEASRRRMTKLKILHQITKLLTVFFFWRFLMSRSKKLRDLWSRFLGLIASMFKYLPMAITA
ncbi:CLUMA_CG010977, isoform A [Clunio marinus]|uniref:Fatty acyl-CoA reductase n=1 Tax=Clunio marinus TaxID=568069 RepID=A0A1J1IBH8_9DIPT|nr:CLUMA_CG010977, isoform A [Clunio marinus]